MMIILDVCNKMETKRNLSVAEKKQNASSCKMHLCGRRRRAWFRVASRIFEKMMDWSIRWMERRACLHKKESRIYTTSFHMEISRHEMEESNKKDNDIQIV